MKSKIFSSSMVKENLKQQIWILGLTALAFIFLYPVLLMTQFDQWKAFQYPYEMIQSQYEKFLSVDGLGSVVFAVVTVIAILCAVVNFEYLHSTKKLDCYHSLPVRRSQLYWQRIWASLITFVVPYIVAAFLMICVGASHGYFSFHILKLAGSSFVVFLVYFLLIYGVCVLAVMLTGRLLVGILGTGVLLLYVPVVYQLFRGYASMFFATYAGVATEPGTILYYIDHYGSPVSWGLTLMNKNQDSESMILAILGGIVAAILLLFVDLWIYKKRSTEAAGRSMAFVRAGLVIQFLMEVPAVLAAGLIGHDMVSEHSTIWWIASMLVSIIIVHGVIEVIYQADFRKFFAHLPGMAVSAAAVALICLFYQTDLIGYDQYLPEQSALASVDVEGNSVTGVYQTYLKKRGDSWKFEESYRNPEENYLRLNPDSAFYSFLEKTIQEGVKDYESESGTTMVNVRYSLTNGKHAYRNYVVDLEQLHDAAQSIIQAENFKDVFYAQLDQKSDYVSDISYENGNTYTLYYDSDRTQSEAKNEILKLLSEDVEEADESVFKEEPIGVLSVSYRDASQSDRSSDYISFSNEAFLIYPDFERTCAFLEKEGVSPEGLMKASDVENITIYTWNEADGSQEDLKEYDTPQDIQDIIPSLRLTGTWTAWGEVRDQERSAEVKMKNGTENDQSLQFGYSITLDKTRELLGN